MQTLTSLETSLVAGGAFADLTRGQQVEAGMAVVSGAVIGLAAASHLSRTLKNDIAVGMAVHMAGLFLGGELGGAIWGANDNLSYYNFFNARLGLFE